MNKFAEFIDEQAYQHFKHAMELNHSSQWDEYYRARLRAASLKKLAVGLGVSNYSYWKRLDDETTYNDCE
jgi:hypothetical protein